MYTEEHIKATQTRLLTLAISIRNILEKENIPYFITYGTLLGAIRHKGFIPWDDDFDFYLFSDTYDYALKVLRNNLPDNMFVEYFDSEPLYFHAWAHVKDLHTSCECKQFPQDGLYAHHGVSVDLYRLHKMKEHQKTLFQTQEHIKYLERRKKLQFITEEAYDDRMKNLLPLLDFEMNKYKQTIDKGRDIYTAPLGSNAYFYLEELFPLKKYTFEGEQFYGPNNADPFLQRCYGNYMQLPPLDKRTPHYDNVKFLD